MRIYVYSFGACFGLLSVFGRASPAHAQNTRWVPVFARSTPMPVELKAASSCFGAHAQPDSVALAATELSNVMYWNGTQWTNLGAGWATDTVMAALHSVECDANGSVHFAIVERDRHYLRLNVFPLPGEPVDIIRGRVRGALVPLSPVALSNGTSALLSASAAADSAAAQGRREAAAEAKREAADARARRKELLAKGWSKDIVDDVLHGSIRIGFTPAMVTEALGEPDHVNVTVSEYEGRTEQWVYGVGTYIYFRNGRVTSMQYSR